MPEDIQIPPGWPPALSIDVAPVLRLFTGENFYSSADAALREAVLNAIDAVGRRRESDESLRQNIQIVFDRTEQTVSISDNGDGMTQENVATLFAKVGASASKIALGGKQDYRAVGEFGIGALSYFLVCNKYQIQTKTEHSEPLGLEFSDEMLDGKSQAKELIPCQKEVGTTLILFLKASNYFDLLTQKFSNWMRNVEGLNASILPENKPLPQGGLTRTIRSIKLDSPPDWIEKANIGPPEQLDIWERYDGKGHVDVLYRGVFVERIEIDGLWAIEGAIHVDPKHFRPKLNREGFVGENLKADVTPYLTLLHPAVLEEAIECIRDLLTSKGDWSLQKAVTLWLAVPRSAQYQRAAQAWDLEFKKQKAFRILAQDSEKEVPVNDLLELNAEKIFLAPDNLGQADPVISQAVRVLRARGELVVQGLLRDSGYLSSVSLMSNSSTWLLLNSFKQELPPIIQVDSVAADIVDRESIAEVYSIAPIVKLMRLGLKAAPFVAVKNEIWINIEADNGKNILKEICLRNEGHLGLWVACMKFAPEQAQGLEQVANFLRRAKPEPKLLGLVRRQFLRKFVE